MSGPRAQVLEVDDGHVVSDREEIVAVVVAVAEGRGMRRASRPRETSAQASCAARSAAGSGLVEEQIEDRLARQIELPAEERGVERRR